MYLCHAHADTVFQVPEAKRPPIVTMVTTNVVSLGIDACAKPKRQQTQ